MAACEVPLDAGGSGRDADVEILQRAWEAFEIAGPALVEMRLFRWLYGHPDASAAEIHQTVQDIGDALWAEFHAPVVIFCNAPAPSAVLPRLSAVSAASGNSFLASLVEPTQAILPSLIATASAEGCRGSIVMIRALSNSRSGFGGACINAAGAEKEPAAIRMNKDSCFMSGSSKCSR